MGEVLLTLAALKGGLPESARVAAFYAWLSARESGALDNLTHSYLLHRAQVAWWYDR